MPISLSFSPQHPDGYYFIEEPDKQLIEGETYNCCHCGYIVKIKVGSGTLRGYCRMCGALTCGRGRCMSHNPLERQIEAEERADYRRRMTAWWI